MARSENSKCGWSGTCLLPFDKMPVGLCFDDGSSVDFEMWSMTMAMIICAVPEFKFSRRGKRSRHEMLEKVATLPSELQNKIRVSAKEKVLRSSPKPWRVALC